MTKVEICESSISLYAPHTESVLILDGIDAICSFSFSFSFSLSLSFSFSLSRYINESILICISRNKGCTPILSCVRTGPGSTSECTNVLTSSAYSNASSVTAGRDKTDRKLLITAHTPSNLPIKWGALLSVPPKRVELGTGGAVLNPPICNTIFQYTLSSIGYLMFSNIFSIALSFPFTFSSFLGITGPQSALSINCNGIFE